MKLLLIIPCYNEEKNILRVVKEIEDRFPEYDYIVVNDGSADNTKKVLEEHHINHISHPINCGLAITFQTGVCWALRQKEHYDAVCQFDADGQHLPDHLPQMLEVMYQEDIDIVIGSRYTGGRKSQNDNVNKKVCRKIISGVIRCLAGSRITDPTSGLRMYRDSVYRLFVEDNIVAPEPDTIVYFLKHQYKVKEIAVEMREREYGESYLTVPKAIQYIFNTISSMILIQWWR